MDANEYKMTYYVSAMLAQGGVLYIKEDRLVFAPRALERAVGASDTIIPYEKVKMVEVIGTLSESLMVRTLEKPHKFVGGDIHKIRDRIQNAIEHYHPPVAASPSAAPAPALSTQPIAAAAPKAFESTGRFRAETAPKPESVLCKSCSQPIRSEFHFCPSCKAVLRASCSQCHRALETGWKFCAFCGNPS